MKEALWQNSLERLLKQCRRCGASRPGEVERERRKALALALYQRQGLSFGKARMLAQMTRWEFEELLGQRQIARHYSEDDLREDIEYARGR